MISEFNWRNKGDTFDYCNACFIKAYDEIAEPQSIGLTYYGDIVEGRKDGFGEQTWPNGTVCQGLWLQDLLVEGNLIEKNGNVKKAIEN